MLEVIQERLSVLAVSGFILEGDWTPPVTEKAIEPEQTQLADDLFSFQLQIDDITYKFPMTFSEFGEKEWTFEGEYRCGIGGTMLTYRQKTYNEVRLQFDSENKLSDVTIQNSGE